MESRELSPSKDLVAVEKRPNVGLKLWPLAWTYAVLSAAAVSLVSVLAP